MLQTHVLPNVMYWHRSYAAADADAADADNETSHNCDAICALYELVVNVNQ